MKTYQESYCVYCHKSKVNGKVYVGMTKMKPEYRWNHGKGYESSARFSEAIKQYGWESFEHIILDENLTRDQAILKEKEYISLYEATNPEKGFNVSCGGDKPFEGLHHTDDARSRISKKLKLREFSDEHKANISKSKSGVNHHMAKKVVQYTKDGKYIKTWDYMNEAAKTLGIQKGNISLACLNKRPSAGGYLWKYEEAVS